jgi:HAD superfamily hydrolase (TIGR01509 family)
VCIIENWRPNAVVFDCDGLLVDTEPCWTIAEVEVFARRGLKFGLEQKTVLLGKSILVLGAAIAELIGEPGNHVEIWEEVRELAIDAISSQAKDMPGALNIVEMVSAVVPVAVASNSPRDIMEIALKRGGFENMFQVTVAGDEVTRPKPAPDLYLKTCELLGVIPDTVLAFEDSMTGVRAAESAGLWVVGVPTLANSKFSANLVVDSLADLELLVWISRW